MARKRKIPARKHHGIRDPLKQIEDKEKKLKNVVNNPPSREDDQKVSFKFSQFKKLADDAKAGKKFKKIHRGTEDKPSKKKTVISSANQTAGKPKTFRPIKQFDSEADEDYLKRVNRITSASLKEAQYEAKYGVNVIRNPDTGEITIQKRPKNEIDELLKQKQKERRSTAQGRKKKKEKAKPMDPKEAKELIKQALREQRMEDKESAPVEEYKRDVFRFGEVVHAPPSLVKPRKAMKNETVPRPGKKDSLLLKSLLREGEEPTDKAELQQPAKSTPGKKKSGKTAAPTITKRQLQGKRKDLPAATRQMLESEQKKFIELYRNLKKTKVQAL